MAKVLGPRLGLARRFAASAARYDFKDPLRFTGLLTEDERMIMDQAHSFAQDYLFPQVVETNKIGRAHV